MSRLPAIYSIGLGIVMETIILDTSKILDFVQNLNTGQEGIIGQAFLYNLMEFEKGIKDSGQNLDQFITRKIAEQLYLKVFKTPAMFFYAPYPHQFNITACMKGQKASFGWLRELPGYVESSQAYIPDHAESFLYWDGQKAFRIFEKPSDYQPGDYLICDFGGLGGLSIETAPKEIFDQIRSSPSEDPFYSFIPEIPVWLFSNYGRELSIYYAFYEVRNTNTLDLPTVEQLRLNLDEPFTESKPDPKPSAHSPKSERVN